MFDHIDHELTRWVLSGVLLDNGSIDEALDFAKVCLEEDFHNKDVTYGSYRLRRIHLEDALNAWDGAGDVLATVKSLQLFWCV